MKKKRRRMRTCTSQTTDAALQQQSVSACHSKRDSSANTSTQTTPTYDKNEEVVMKVKTQKKTVKRKVGLSAESERRHPA
jgi:hypothetical protein